MPGFLCHLCGIDYPTRAGEARLAWERHYRDRHYTIPTCDAPDPSPDVPHYGPGP